MPSSENVEVIKGVIRNRRELRCAGGVSSSCSAGGTRRVTNTRQTLSDMEILINVKMCITRIIQIHIHCLKLHLYFRY